jgi:hypothetical protein
MLNYQRVTISCHKSNASVVQDTLCCRLRLCLCFLGHLAAQAQCYKWPIDFHDDSVQELCYNP